MLGPLSKAFMNLPVGEIQAAAAGPPGHVGRPHPHVRDVAGGGDPNFEAEFPARHRRQPRDDAGGHEGDGRGAAGDHQGHEPRSASEIERATANLPSPTYPDER